MSEFIIVPEMITSYSDGQVPCVCDVRCASASVNICMYRTVPAGDFDCRYIGTVLNDYGNDDSSSLCCYAVSNMRLCDIDS